MGIKHSNIYLFSDIAHEEVEHLPLFEILYTPFLMDLTPFDSLVLTSKNSVKALEKNSLDWHEKACYAIGEGTAKAIEKAGGQVAFTCNASYGDEFAHEIIPLLKDKHVFFPRAKEVISPLYDILLQAGISITQQIVYESVCKKYTPENAPSKGAILIFTSPSTVHCFHQNFTWDESYRAIAIGKKTAAVLPSGVIPFLPSKQTIAECIELAKQIRS